MPDSIQISIDRFDSCWTGRDGKEGPSALVCSASGGEIGSGFVHHFKFYDARLGPIRAVDKAFVSKSEK
jgi:hypothetical protein